MDHIQSQPWQDPNKHAMSGFSIVAFVYVTLCPFNLVTYFILPRSAPDTGSPNEPPPPPSLSPSPTPSPSPSPSHSPSPTPAHQEPAQKKGVSIGMIAGIVAGIAAAIVAGVVLAWFIQKRQLAAGKGSTSVAAAAAARNHKLATATHDMETDDTGDIAVIVFGRDRDTGVQAAPGKAALVR